MDVLPATIAVTGVAGVVAQRLLPLLDAMDGIERVVGLDVREPARRVRRFEFHRVDIASSDLTAVLRGVDTIVHLAGVDSGGNDGALLTHVNVDGTRRVLDAAATAGVRRIVQTSSAAVYGAWPNNPVPITEDGALRPNPGFLPALHDAENERRLQQWRESHAGVTATTLRMAPVVGPGAHGLFARAALGRPPVALRGASRPIQVVHVDDAVSAIALAIERDLDGVFNVAADGWVSEAVVRGLAGNGPPSLPDDVARRVLQVLWASGLGDAPPAVLPYLVDPWVVANDLLRAHGWAPAHSNESAISASLPLTLVPTGRRRAVMTAAVVAGTAGAGLGAVRVARRLQVRRSRP
jgi:nucleoside-diphosphate-sugar epimerase